MNEYHICRWLCRSVPEDRRKPIGVKDRFGPEIYEGDIVEYYGALWEVRKDGEDYWIANPENDNIPIAPSRETLENSQVVGSIYEDPLTG